MRDVSYVLVTVGFFLLMVIYVGWCERLGRDGTGEEDRK
jgi:hypothetical protein